MKDDLYRILGVHPSATEEDLKRAYREQARKTHPDLNPAPGSAAQFQRVHDAYEVLRDGQRRAAYDLGQRSSFTRDNAPPKLPGQVQPAWAPSGGEVLLGLALFGGAAFVTKRRGWW